MGERKCMCIYDKSFRVCSIVPASISFHRFHPLSIPPAGFDSRLGRCRHLRAAHRGVSLVRRALWEPHLGDHGGLPGVGRHDAGLQRIAQPARGHLLLGHQWPWPLPCHPQRAGQDYPDCFELSMRAAISGIRCFKQYDRHQWRCASAQHAVMAGRFPGRHLE